MDRWAQAVRDQLGLGRLLPLGGAEDGAWLAESAASGVLRHAGDALGGVKVGRLDVSPVEDDAPQPGTGGAGRYALPAPPTALPPGALRIEAEFAATAEQPLTTAADRLRAALLTASERRLGLEVTEVDLRVTTLLDGSPEGSDDGSDATGSGATGSGASPRPKDSGAGGPAEGEPDGDEARAARAARAVPGVAALTAAFGGRGRSVRIEEPEPQGGAEARTARHIRVEVGTAPGHRVLDVALAVRAAVASAFPDHPTVAVLVTEVAPG
ncbi:hypothetical protein B1H18_26215 [Streptomyces tsukubensis]|uniref:Nucleopolyhedrovirus P10 family protein n=1 Tax=Streptomyces tsukubensis TaxID=83656 RepID=A0A1V4A2B5_9ACTN|nr:hypothetical protein B1H18_26215 [Streptomyces tsukubensis]